MIIELIEACKELDEVTQYGWKSNNISGYGLCDDVFETTLLDIYHKCGGVRLAALVFSKMDAQKTINVGSWNTLIAAYLQNGHALEAFQLFLQMIRRNVREPELVLEYNTNNVSNDEANVSDVINMATEELADNIYDQIKDIIMEYITPEESIMLNVLSTTVDFTTCESTRTSQSVDKTGSRTLFVVTKAGKSPEGLLEKVKVDDVNTGLSYICVRNRISDES
ncbi:unnamed protein product [Vicia faba]|uniref:Dynamin N-terminal domain-containing protein n=1 Tax=Vicia faba TaxID=3906 RepID=A0AAV0Z2I3_VICFA|nr:unnamed protein product [Vicia faba]